MNCGCRWKWRMIIAVYFPIYAIGKKKPEKNQGFNGIRTRDLRDTAAMLYQLSYEATHWERGHLIEFISSREEWNDVKFISISCSTQTVNQITNVAADVCKDAIKRTSGLTVKEIVSNSSPLLLHRFTKTEVARFVFSKKNSFWLKATWETLFCIYTSSIDVLFRVFFFQLLIASCHVITSRFMGKLNSSPTTWKVEGFFFAMNNFVPACFS